MSVAPPPTHPRKAQSFGQVSAFFESLQKQRSRTASALVLLDSRGKKLSSEELASWLGRQRDEGRQRIIFRDRSRRRLVGRGARAGGSSPVPWPHDPSARTGPGGPERAGLPGIYNPCWASVPHGALRTGRPERQIRADLGSAGKRSGFDRVAARTGPDQHRTRQG